MSYMTYAQQNLRGKMRTLYLNNSGHRWINVDANGNRERIKFSHNGEQFERSVIHWDAIGNFAVPTVNFKGKRVLLSDSSTDEGWTINEFSLKMKDKRIRH
jgi:hypothetical protein